MAILNRYTYTKTILSSETTTSLTITAVTMANTVVRASYSVDSTEPEDRVSYELTSTTNIDLARNNTSSAVTLYFEIIEYDTSVNVQRGSFSWPANRSGVRGEHDITLTAVVLANAWPEINRGSNTNGSVVGNDDFDSSYLSSTTNIKFNQTDTSTEEGFVVFQVMETTDVNVTQGTATLTGSATGDLNNTISAVNLANTMVVCDWQTQTGGSKNISSNEMRAWLPSTTAWSFQRSANTGSADVTGRVKIVENANWSVQTANTAFSTTQTTQSPSLTTVTVADCFVVAAGRLQCGGETDYSSDDNEGTAMYEFSLASSALTLTRALHGSAASTISWYVVEESGGAAGAALVGATSMSILAAAVLSTGINLAAATDIVDTTGADLTTQIQLSSTVSITDQVSAGLSTGIPLLADTNISDNASAGLTTSIQMAGDTNISFSDAADLTAGGAAAALSGAVDITSLASADLTTQIQLSAVTQVSDQATAGLTTGIPLVADAVISDNASADLATGINLAGGTDISFSAVADLLVGGSSLSGAVNITNFVTADLTTQIPLSGDIGLSVFTGADLATQIKLSAAASEAVDATAALSTGIPLESATNINIQALASLEAPINLVGATAISFESVADISTGIALQSGASESVSTIADLTTAIQLAGASDFSFQTTALLTIGETLVPDSRIYAIESENRTYAIPEDDRTYAIEAENRTYPIT